MLSLLAHGRGAAAGALTARELYHGGDADATVASPARVEAARDDDV